MAKNSEQESTEQEFLDVPCTVIPLTSEQIAEQEAYAAGAYQREYDRVTVNRQAGYQSISDPIFMQYQRGEATEQEWLDAVQAVKDANPYPVQGK